MYLWMRRAAEGVNRAQWSGWARVACLALLGVGFQLHQEALAQSWPGPSGGEEAYTAYCAGGALGSTCNGAYRSEADAYASVTHYCQEAYEKIGPISLTPNAPSTSAVYWACRVIGTYSESNPVFVWGEYHPAQPGSCPSGSSLSGNECIPDTCSSTGGAQVSFDVRVRNTSSCGSSPLSYVCLPSGCRAAVYRSQCTWFAQQGTAPATSFYTGEAQSVTSGPCQSSDYQASYSAAPGSSVSAGGVGVIEGGAESSADSANLARIATNTAMIAGTLSGGSSTSGSSCGGSGELPCATTLDETGVAASGEASKAGQDADRASMASAVDGQIAGMTLDNLPTFDQGGSKWTLSFLPFLTASGPLDCKVEGQVPLVGQQMTFGYNFCGLSDYVKAILYWVFAVGTVVGIWNMVYGRTD